MSVYDVMHCTYLVASCRVLINFVHCDKYVEYPLDFWFVEHFYLFDNVHTDYMFLLCHICAGHMICKTSSVIFQVYGTSLMGMWYVYDLFSYYICMLLAVIII